MLIIKFINLNSQSFFYFNKKFKNLNYKKGLIKNKFEKYYFKKNIMIFEMYF